MALPRRFSRTWSRRSSSPSTRTPRAAPLLWTESPRASAWGRSCSRARRTRFPRSTFRRSIASRPARRCESSRISFTRCSTRSVLAAMMSTRRACFGTSGPGTSSRRSVVASRTEVSGVRSSWEMCEKKSSFIRSTSRSRSAMRLNACASCPISSRLSTSSGAPNDPSATSVVALERRSSDRVMRTASSPAPRSASSTVAGSAIRTPFQVRRSTLRARSWDCSSAA